MNDKRVSTPYPIGTKIAEGYGLDLDREAREGRPARFGAMAHGPQDEERPWSFLHGLLLLVLTVIAIGGLWRLSRHARMPLAHRAPAVRTGLVEATYPDVRSASGAGALTRGEVPMFLPRGATAIREGHDKGSREAWLTFVFPPNGDRRWAASFIPINVDDGFSISVAGPDAGWWPRGLRGNLNDSELRSTWSFYYTGRLAWTASTGLFIAIDWSRGRAALWREAAKGR